MDPIMSNVHNRMHMVLMSKNQRKNGEIMFKPELLARVIDKFEGQYSDTDSDEGPTNERVKAIVKENIKTEKSTAKIDKLLALNEIRTLDVLWQEKKQKFVLPRFIKKKSAKINEHLNSGNSQYSLSPSNIRMVGVETPPSSERKTDAKILQEHSRNVRQ